MKEQKHIFTVSVLLAVVTLILSIVGEWNWIHISNTIFSGHRDFLVSVCLNVFSGTIVGALLALISYFIQRRKTAVAYWLELAIYLQKIQIFGYEYIECAKNLDSCIEKINESASLSSEMFELETSYTNLIQLHFDFSTLTSKDEIGKLMDEISKLSGDMNCQLTEIWHIQVFDDKVFPREDKKRHIEEFDKRELLDSLQEKEKELQQLLNIKIKTPPLPEKVNELLAKCNFKR